MIAKTPSYASLERVLLQLGFTRQATAGTQVVFRDAATDTLVVLPPGQPHDPVAPIHLTAISRLLSERGIIASQEAFDALIAATLQHA